MALLLGLSGQALAEPLSEADAPAGDDAAVGVWGDPEENEPRDSSWTWFGMGYERRTGAAGAARDGRDKVQAPGLGAGGAEK